MACQGSLGKNWLVSERESIKLAVKEFKDELEIKKANAWKRFSDSLSELVLKTGVAIVAIITLIKMLWR